MIRNYIHTTDRKKRFILISEICIYVKYDVKVKFILFLVKTIKRVPIKIQGFNFRL